MFWIHQGKGFNNTRIGTRLQTQKHENGRRTFAGKYSMHCKQSQLIQEIAQLPSTMYPQKLTLSKNAFFLSFRENNKLYMVALCGLEKNVFIPQILFLFQTCVMYCRKNFQHMQNILTSCATGVTYHYLSSKQSCKLEKKTEVFFPTYFIRRLVAV